MSESPPAPKATEPASSAPKPDATSSKPPAKPLKPQNPVFKMMGLPRMRLPSRNWTIFLTVSTSLAAAIIYDKRETKRAQLKWRKIVEHLSQEQITDNKVMPRKLRVFLEAPPGDGLRIAQDHFKEYVKPILVASGVDWEFVQGRREGDIRSEVAERIRKLRKGEFDEADPIESIRKNAGIMEFDGVNGDIVIGRHTWKEYVRGLHEGWLGPVEAPAPPPVENQTLPESENKPETLPGITLHGSPTESEAPKPETAEEKDKAVVKLIPQPYISPSEYTSASLPAIIPSEFDPTYPIPFPHVLGFFNTPTRFHRFLTRRRLADSIGRDTAAVILSSYRPFSATTSSNSSESSFAADAQSPVSSDDPSLNIKQEKSEISEALQHEEKDWHKSVFNPPAPTPPETDSSEPQETQAEPEKTWISPLITDPRIASRMRKAELSAEDESKAKQVVVREEEIEGKMKGGLRWIWRWGMGKLEKGEREKAVEMERRNKLLEESGGD